MERDTGNPIGDLETTDSTSHRDTFLCRWGRGPLAIYVAGVMLPVMVASMRVGLMPVLGVAVYAMLFWTGPFVSAAAIFWSRWSTGWRCAWVLSIPALVAVTFLPLLV